MLVARLFVAADLPADVRAALSEMPVPGRRVAAQSLHVTLCFLGEVEGASVEAVRAVVAGLQPPARAITLSLGDVVWLPPRRPRVCAVELDDPDGALGLVQGSLSAALVAGGWYEPEHRRFRAHVTVARLGRGGPRRRPSAVAPPAPTPFAVPSVTLYRSFPGSRYEALCSVALPLDSGPRASGSPACG